MIISFITILNIRSPKIKRKEIELKYIVKDLLKDKITKIYLVNYLVSKIAMDTGLGLKMLMLTNIFKFSDGNATNYLLIVGLLADILGIIALRYLTGKNDYITITIKFGIRFLIYALAFFTSSMIVCFIAITWSILISTAYENITDAPYINRIKNEYQFVFTNIRYILGMLGTAIGLYFAGIMYNKGIQYILGLSAFFMIFQISMAYYNIYLRNKESISHANNRSKELSKAI